MDNLKKLSIDDLVDILITQTTLLLQMHADGASKIEFEKCSQLILSVQEEIKSRKETKTERI